MRPANQLPQSSSTGRVRGTRPPTAALELVHLVTGLRPEELGQIGGVVRNQVHHHHLGVAGRAVGTVLLRDAYEEARWADAALGREAHEAAGAVAGGGHGHDEHRVVELVDQLVDALRRIVELTPRLGVAHELALC